jgi:hypothetical protein
MKKPIHKVWTFRSDSDPEVRYQTLQYSDGTTSCECRGWCRRVAVDGSRSCKHTRWVDQGIADRHCTAAHDYDNHKPQPSVQNHVQPQIKTTPKLGQRKFAV